MKVFFERSLVHIVVVGAVCLLAYANSFSVPFIFDDGSSIVENKVIRDVGSFLFSGEGYDYNPRRFIGYLTFALNYRWGGLEVGGYHAVNLLIHLLNSLLVYYFVVLTFRTPLLRGSGLGPAAKGIALFSAALFAVHPVQTQAVTYIVQRLTSLATLFYVGAVCLYVRFRLGQEGAGGAGRREYVLYGLGLLGAVLAMKTKEIAFTLPFVVALYEAVFFGGGGLKRRVLWLLPVLATALIIPVSMVNVDKPVGELLSDVSEATVVQTDMTRGEYLVTQFRVIVTYLRLLVLPVGQNLDYDYPLYRSVFELPVMLSLVLVLGLFAAALALWRRARQGGEGALGLIAFGILWFFLTLAVESSIIPIADVIFEHRLYLPSVGAFAAAATAVFLLAGIRKELPRTLPVIALIAVTGALALVTLNRNTVWSDNVTLWADAVRKSPGKVRPYNNLGAALSDANRLEEASQVLLQALAVKPDHPEAYYNLGRIYLIQGRVDDAVALLTRAVALKRDYHNAYVNLAAAYVQQGKSREALDLLEYVRPSLPDRPDLHFNLGVAHYCLGNRAAALQELSMVEALDPQLAPQLRAFIEQQGRCK